MLDFSSKKCNGFTTDRNSCINGEIYSKDPDPETLDYKASALAIELCSSKAIAGKKLSLSSIASLYIYHFSSVLDFSSEKYSGSTGHKNSFHR